ncbi:MAG: F0F1 ATP synthase subunit epsilon [Dehalococcoidales bacterium]|nr:F0F1 ATP synthase subunit epsilon [Dehalococcoidales bacterium]
MPKLKVEVVTAERIVYSAEADIVIAPGIEGQLGILPHHAPLMTMLRPGELIIRRGQEEDIMAVSGGFLEVRPDRVVILADAAERAEEIDVARAEAARKRAEEKLKARHAAGIDEAQAEAALRRAIARLTVVEKAKQRRKR